MHIPELKGWEPILGLTEKCSNRRKDELTGTQVKATDLRAGAALIIAGLAASGTTEIHDIEHIDRDM